LKKNRFKEAINIVKTTDNYSISFLQRTMGIGYNRAANLMKIIRKYKYHKGQIATVLKKNLLTSKEQINYILMINIRDLWFPNNFTYVLSILDFHLASKRLTRVFKAKTF